LWKLSTTKHTSFLGLGAYIPKCMQDFNMGVKFYGGPTNQKKFGFKIAETFFLLNEWKQGMRKFAFLPFLADNQHCKIPEFCADHLFYFWFLANNVDWELMVC
jgi:hypothetical protein